MTTWKDNLRECLATIAAYDVEPSQAPTVLNANECAEPWPQEVRDACAKAISQLPLHRYPDTSGRRLRAILGQRHNCHPDRVVLGCGSDETISLLIHALSGNPNACVLVPDPSFVMYDQAARLFGLEVVKVALDADFQLDEAALREVLQSRIVTLCFLARPNNPTSTLFSAEVIERLMQDFPQTIFVVDEAYAAYDPGCSMWRPDRPENYVFMSTFSKIGLAEIRLGYCIAAPALAEQLHKVRHPYNVSLTTLTIAETILSGHGDVIEQQMQLVLRRREEMRAILQRIPESKLYPSHANIVLVQLGSAARAKALVSDLADRGVIVKYAGAWPRLADCVRISVGTRDDLARLDGALREAGWIGQ